MKKLLILIISIISLIIIYNYTAPDEYTKFMRSYNKEETEYLEYYSIEDNTVTINDKLVNISIKLKNISEKDIETKCRVFYNEELCNYITGINPCVPFPSEYITINKDKSYIINISTEIIYKNQRAKELLKNMYIEMMIEDQTYYFDIAMNIIENN